MRAAQLNVRSTGFTLLEMVITIVILGVIGATFGVFIVPAMNAHQAMQNRAALIDSAEIALRRMARDIRIALPNSVRISSTVDGFAVEMIPTLDGGRYCIAGLANCSGATQELDLSAADTDFDILGCFNRYITTALPATVRVVIGDASGQVYTAAGSPAVMTPSGTSVTLSTVNGGGVGAGTCGQSSGGNFSFRHHIALSAGHQFVNASGRERVFIVDKPVTYVCNKTAKTLTRYSNYPITSVAPTPLSPPSGAGISTALVTDKVTDCSVISDSAYVQTNGYVKLTITLTNGGEDVKLFDQVQIDNSL
jgi:MSHA biogenesis protein MshO